MAIRFLAGLVDACFPPGTIFPFSNISFSRAKSEISSVLVVKNNFPWRTQLKFFKQWRLSFDMEQIDYGL